MKLVICIALLLIPLIITNLSIDSEESINNYIASIDMKEHKSKLLSAIRVVEIGGHPDEPNKLQILPIMIREVNKILGYEKFSYKDVKNIDKSIEMFTIYTDHHTPDWDLEKVSRRWNGGPKGDEKIATYRYYKKVERVFNKTYSD